MVLILVFMMKMEHNLASVKDELAWSVMKFFFYCVCNIF